MMFILKHKKSGQYLTKPIGCFYTGDLTNDISIATRYIKATMTRSLFPYCINNLIDNIINGDREYIDRRISHLSEENVFIHAKALISISGGELD